MSDMSGPRPAGNQPDRSSNTLEFDGEQLNRTLKILIDSGRFETVADAQDTMAAWRIHVHIGADATTLAAQAAAVTAVVTSARAVGRVTFHAAPPAAAAHCMLPGEPTATLAETLIRHGGEPVPAIGASPDLARTIPVIVIGEPPEPIAGSPTVQVTWHRWTAHVSQDGAREAEDDAMILAPVAAAALAVTETFAFLTGDPDACRRTRALSLWQPDRDASVADAGPDLDYLPDGAWLIGLGHLGQAYAWCWRLLPYADPSTCRLIVQDVDDISEANRSTGLLVSSANVGEPKTRVAAAFLEAAGFKTRLVERRILEPQLPAKDEPTLALFGVDNVKARRSISTHGFSFVVDAGLGTGAIDYTSISLKTFPALGSSEDVAAWRKEPVLDAERLIETNAAYKAAFERAGDDAAQQCGILLLAGRSAAAAFVGVLAACLAVAEPLRLLHGGQTTSAAVFNAARPRPVRGGSTSGTPRIGYLPARQRQVE